MEKVEKGDLLSWFGFALLDRRRGIDADGRSLEAALYALQVLLFDRFLLVLKT